jgi:hypothetical protein
MPTNSGISIEDGDMIVENELHTKYATPRKLSRELKDLLGDSTQFKVEVRMLASQDMQIFNLTVL